MSHRLSRPIGVDLFAGAGGMSLGFEQAGFDVVAAVELDPVHACTHKFNFPRTEVLATSVIGLRGDRIREIARIGSRSVDVVFGGAPCQGFSLIGQRALADPRNALVEEFVRLVCELDASYFVFENVKGLTVGRHRAFLDELIEEFLKSGYNVVQRWQVLNSANFGVPQHRERLFLMGAKKGLRLPKYPSLTCNIAGCAQPIKGLPFGPSCQDALADLPNADDFPELLNSDTASLKAGMPSTSYARRLRGLDNQPSFEIERLWNRELLTSSSRTNHTSITRRRFTRTPAGQIEPISRLFKLPRDGVSNTLRAGTDSARGAFTSPRPIHYEYARCVTVREMARLHGYPDWFRFHTTKWHGARQIGNSVPPPLAKAVAEEIMAARGIVPVRNEVPIVLRDTDLLSLGMSEAAAYWRIENPIARRNKKSGATKRKQYEIELAALLSE
ncbi:MAG: (cytosine-5)-methyltransferase 1 [Alphaproteobacteria bacterium]|jgi:DNA (cytosine-5)-methyltransferase 1|nr:(cytosine-5)-methyltransferase 1 [Alphaproteobacteria bacterium]